jgi:diguanylate cyclase (GGDEF)-like protein
MLPAATAPSPVPRLLVLARERKHDDALAELDRLLSRGTGADREDLASCRELVDWHRHLVAWNVDAALEPTIAAISRLEQAGFGEFLDWAYSGAGFVLGFVGQFETGLAWAERAAEIARARGDHPALVRVLNNKAAILALAEDFDGAIRAFVEALSMIAPGPGLDRVMNFQNQASTFILHALSLQPADPRRTEISRCALDAADAGLAVTDPLAAPRWHAWGLGNRGSALALLGRTAEAEASFLEALPLADAAPRTAVEILVGLAKIRIDQGRYEEASAFLDDATARAPTDVFDGSTDRLMEAKVRLEVSAGHIEEALRWSERRFRRLERQYRTRLRYVAQLARLSAELDEVRRAERLAREEADTMARRVEILVGQSQRWMDEALRDPLTGLLNRRGLEAAASELFVPGQNVGVAVLDLDHFKSINDRYGHAVGDAVLVRATTLLSGTTRDGDILARTGGEEFCVLLRSVTPAQATQASERLLARLRDASWDDVVPGLRVTASIGLALREGSEMLESVARRADVVLYQAKAEGRDRVQRWR